MVSKYTFNASSPGIFTIGEPTARSSTDEEDEEEEAGIVEEREERSQESEENIQQRANVKAIAYMKVWSRYILVFCFIMSIGYTLLTTSCYDTEGALTKYKSGFYYMTVLTGMLWINTITIGAICFLSHLDRPFSFGVKFLLMWKFFVINLTTIFFVAAFFSFHTRANSSNRFLFPLVIFSVYYLMFVYLVFASRSVIMLKVHKKEKTVTQVQMSTFPRERIEIEPLPALSTLV